MLSCLNMSFKPMDRNLIQAFLSALTHRALTDLAWEVLPSASKPRGTKAQLASLIFAHAAGDDEQKRTLLGRFTATQLRTWYVLNIGSQPGGKKADIIERFLSEGAARTEAKANGDQSAVSPPVGSTQLVEAADRCHGLQMRRKLHRKWSKKAAKKLLSKRMDQEIKIAVASDSKMSVAALQERVRGRTAANFRKSEVFAYFWRRLSSHLERARLQKQRRARKRKKGNHAAPMAIVRHASQHREMQAMFSCDYESMLLRLWSE